MDPNQLTNEVERRDPASLEDVPAWDEIAAGRYSCRVANPWQFPWPRPGAVNVSGCAARSGRAKKDQPSES